MNELSPTAFRIDRAARRASARPRDPAFFRDPYAFYAELHATNPAFLWEEYGHWCFAGFKEVNALLRDKRFGRQILHLMTREQLGLPQPKPHTAAFDQTEKYSLLTLERRRIRGCATSSTAPSCRATSSSSAPGSSGWPTSWSTVSQRTARSSCSGHMRFPSRRLSSPR